MGLTGNGRLAVLRIAIAERHYGILILHTCQGRTLYVQRRQDSLYQCRAGLFIASLTNDIQAADSSSERHIEQVQVIYGVLQVLVQIITFVDSSSQLFHAVVDRR